MIDFFKIKEKEKEKEKLLKWLGKILIETVPNEHMKIYHFRMKKLSTDQLTRIHLIEGIIPSSYSNRELYSLTVQKGKVFEWDEIHPTIVKILAEGMI